jgi:hypothetical protein
MAKPQGKGFDIPHTVVGSRHWQTGRPFAAGGAGGFFMSRADVVAIA